MCAFDRLRALRLLAECTGDDIWSLQHCRSRGVPQHWLEELADCFESNPQRDDETIYVEDRPSNQYEGVRDVVGVDDVVGLPGRQRGEPIVERGHDAFPCFTS